MKRFIVISCILFACSLAGHSESVVDDVNRLNVESQQLLAQVNELITLTEQLAQQYPQIGDSAISEKSLPNVTRKLTNICNGFHDQYASIIYTICECRRSLEDCRRQLDEYILMNAPAPEQDIRDELENVVLNFDSMQMYEAWMVKYDDLQKRYTLPENVARLECYNFIMDKQESLFHKYDANRVEKFFDRDFDELIVQLVSNEQKRQCYEMAEKLFNFEYIDAIFNRVIEKLHNSQLPTKEEIDKLETIPYYRNEFNKNYIDKYNQLLKQKEGYINSEKHIGE